MSIERCRAVRAGLPSVVLVAFCSVIASCGDGSTAPEVTGPVVTIELSAASATLVSLGATYELDFTARDADGRVVSVASASWTSSAPAVATVDGSGAVTARLNGVATISATVGAVSASASVTVEQRPDALAFRAHPTAVEAGAEMGQPVEVEIQDAGGTIVRNVAREITLSLMDPAGTATIFGELAATTADGLATFSGISIDMAGSGYRLEATTSGLPSAESDPFDVLAPQLIPDRLAFLTQPQRTEARQPLSSVQVEILDVDGKRVTNSILEVLMELQSNRTRGSLAGETRAIAVNGVATFDGLVVDWPSEGFSLKATSEELDEAVSERFDVWIHFRSVDAGRLHSCAISTRDELYCWGRGDSGELGAGPEVTGTVTPAPVMGTLQWASVDAGQTSTCGVTLDGQAYCWGLNTTSVSSAMAAYSVATFQLPWLEATPSRSFGRPSMFRVA